MEKGILLILNRVLSIYLRSHDLYAIVYPKEHLISVGTIFLFVQGVQDFILVPFHILYLYTTSMSNIQLH